MRHRPLSLILLLLVVVAVGQAEPVANPSANFTLSTEAHIPGATLKSGTYTIEVLNRLSDRTVLQVEDAKGRVKATFLGIPDKKIARPEQSGPVSWDKPIKNANYLRGWYFHDSDAVIEFVYPKAEAVSIAKANPEKVPAVDPASQGIVPDKNLSQHDMQLLTLWVLSLDEVGPGMSTGGIKAERYQVASTSGYKPAIKSLPHTAGSTPLIWLLCLCSLIAASGLRLIRKIYKVQAKDPSLAGNE